MNPSEKFIGGKASINFKQLTEYSFWKQEGTVWYLHALMRDYLQDRQRNDEPMQFAEFHQYLFEAYDAKLAHLKQVVDITETHTQALIEASYHLQQWNAKKLPVWANERGEIFYRAYAWEQLEPLWEKVREIAESLLGETHLDTATTLNNLTGLYKAQGKYAEAEPLYQRAIVIMEKSFPDGHPNLDIFHANYADLKNQRIGE